MPELAAFAGLIERGSIITLLIVIIVGGMRGWYIWKGPYDREVKEKEYWREQAIRLLRTTNKAVDLAEAKESKKDELAF